MELTFAEIEAVLASCHQIADEKRSAFQARIKNILRVGYLPSEKSGRGRVTKYSPRDVVLLALAVEFIQLGLSPNHAANIVRKYWARVELSLLQAVESLRGLPPVLIVFDPAALQSLMRHQYREGEIDDVIAAHFFTQTAEFVGDAIESSATFGSGRLAIVNATHLIRKICPAIEAIGGSAEGFMAGLREWADAPHRDLIQGLRMGSDGNDKEA